MNDITPDGVYEEIVDDSQSIATALLAGAGPLRPPKDWFSSPGLTQVTPITVLKEGKVFGHIASWDGTHIGMPNPVSPPHSKHDYAFFRTGVLETDDGTDVPVGQLTLAGGHAALSADAGTAAAHYDNTASAVADVSVGEDVYGIWISGAIRPGVEDTDIRALRASAPSGDWRPINGGLELVAVVQVNVPGFPVARAMIAGGEMLSLVAAGASDMYRRRVEYATVEQFDALADRMARFEDTALSASAATDSMDAQEVRLMAARAKMRKRKV